MTKTFLPSVKETESSRQWHHLDASGKTLGRLATQAAVLLMGKHKKTFTPHMDCGDFVVVTNVGQIKVTGDKANQKVYFTHSGYAKGGKEIPFKRQFEKDPTVVLELAVKRMLDENKLRAPRMKRLKLFAGAEHAFAGQFAQKKAK
ncbi:MAG: 50S ribosomal protein L13 [Elusimicrobium sp.]|jgi:large subunit ribosomal protein L13|nr:50S ribosomal protein L13 [Elusimicrobium sp.]